MLLGNFLLPLLSKLSENRLHLSNALSLRQNQMPALTALIAWGKVHFNEVVTDSYNKVRARNR